MNKIKALANRVRRMTIKDWLSLIRTLIPHAVIIISGMLVVFFVIDRFNKPMGFMTNEFHKRLTFALSLMGLYLAISSIARSRRLERERYRRQLKNAKDAKKSPASPRKPASTPGNASSGRRYT